MYVQSVCSTRLRHAAVAKKGYSSRLEVASLKVVSLEVASLKVVSLEVASLKVVVLKVAIFEVE